MCAIGGPKRHNDFGPAPTVNQVKVMQLIRLKMIPRKKNAVFLRRTRWPVVAVGALE